MVFSQAKRDTVSIALYMPVRGKKRTAAPPAQSAKAALASASTMVWPLLVNVKK